MEGISYICMQEGFNLSKMVWGGGIESMLCKSFEFDEDELATKE